MVGARVRQMVEVAAIVVVEVVLAILIREVAVIAIYITAPRL